MGLVFSLLLLSLQKNLSVLVWFRQNAIVFLFIRVMTDECSIQRNRMQTIDTDKTVMVANMGGSSQ